MEAREQKARAGKPQELQAPWLLPHSNGRRDYPNWNRREAVDMHRRRPHRKDGARIEDLILCLLADVSRSPADVDCVPRCERMTGCQRGSGNLRFETSPFVLMRAVTVPGPGVQSRTVTP